jgi:hypothetical protein
MTLGPNTIKRQTWGRRVRCNPSHRSVRLYLHLHETSVMTSRVPSVPCLHPSSTCFQAKQAARSQRVSHVVFILLSVLWRDRQTVATWFWGSNQETVVVILRPKSPIRSYQFWGTNRKKPEATNFVAILGETVELGFVAEPRNHQLVVSLCTVQTTHNVIWPLDRPVTEYPTCTSQSSVLCPRSPTPAMILIDAHHIAHVTCTPRDKQTRFSIHTG